MANSFADQTKAGDIHGWHVYVLSEKGNAFCKIGSSLTVDYRLQGLQNGNPRTLAVVGDWHLNSRAGARSVEKRALALASKYRLKGRDWLECPYWMAIEFVERAIAELTRGADK